MNDYLSTIPLVLAAIARRLDNISDVPWPLWVGGLFPLYLGMLYCILWFRRGSTWPVRCLYPVTARGRGQDCRNIVPGEWHRCRYHNWRANYRYGHNVDTSIRRWETVDKQGRPIDRPAHGIGFLRAVPGRATLLYYNSFTRPPIDVLKLIPQKVSTVASSLWAMRLRTPVKSNPAQEIRAGIQGVEVAEGLSTVVSATQFTLGAFLVAILGTGAAMLLDGYPTAKAIVQWVAVLGFVLAWAAISRGVYYRRSDWLSSTCFTTVKWWAMVFVPVAAVAMIFG